MVCGSYVYWYNQKYERIGNLFQDRYVSEPVEDDTYFLTAMRYIFQNLVKAKLVANVDYYIWSSYNEFLIKNKMTNVNFVLSMFNRNRETTTKSLIEFTNKPNEDTYLDIKENYRKIDKDA